MEEARREYDDIDSEALGWINTRILLGAVLYGLIAPMGLNKRLCGKNRSVVRMSRA